MSIYDANGTKLRTDYYINPMTAVVPQAANEQGASSAMDLRHTWTDNCGILKKSENNYGGRHRIKILCVALHLNRM